MKKVFILILIMAVSLGAFVGCGKAEANLPSGMDEPMPWLFEEGFSFSHFWDFLYSDIEGLEDENKTVHIYPPMLDAESKTEFTIEDDGLDFSTHYYIMNAENLENIYVADDHPFLKSEDGVLYSKSGETLLRWPAKKPVTKPKSTIKYFGFECYKDCDNFAEDFEIPDGTIGIDKSAFAGARLSRIHIKENVKTVAFGALTSQYIKTIEISSEVAYRSFFSNYNVETVIFNEGVRQIRADQVRKEGYLSNNPTTPLANTRIKNVVFPSTLEAIGDAYFPVNIAVESYELGVNIEYLGNYAFDDLLEHYQDSTIKPQYEIKTHFHINYSNEIIRNYLDKKMPKWDKTWKNLNANQ